MKYIKKLTSLVFNRWGDIPTDPWLLVKRAQEIQSAAIVVTVFNVVIFLLHVGLWLTLWTLFR